MRRALSILVTIAILAAAMVGGYLLTNTFRNGDQSNSRLDRCWSKSTPTDQVDCVSADFERQVRDITGADGANRDRAILAFVSTTDREAARDPRLSGACHTAMHPIGRAEGIRHAKRGTAPQFPNGSSQLCTAGYVHGLAEGYLSTSTDPDIAAVFPSLCHDTDAREGCAHGIGHALLQARGDDPVAPATRTAAIGCKELPESVAINCMNGVYMELAIRRQPAPANAEQFVNACARAPEVEASLACWGYLAQNLRTNDIDLDLVPKWCGRADLPGQFTCIEEYGRMLGTDDVTSCTSSAKLKELRERCVDGAIGLQVGSGHVSGADARDACDELSDRDLRAYCADAVTRYERGRKQLEAS